MLAALVGWLYLFNLPTALEGRYGSAGQVQLSDGRVVDMFHRIQFQGDRFHAMSRQGNAVLETAGSLSRSAHGYRLRVELGEVTRLSAELDNELLFNLLLSRRPGSLIQLYPLGDCLYARATQQLFCPQ